MRLDVINQNGRIQRQHNLRIPHIWSNIQTCGGENIGRAYREMLQNNPARRNTLYRESNRLLGQTLFGCFQAYFVRFLLWLSRWIIKRLVQFRLPHAQSSKYSSNNHFLISSFAKKTLFWPKTLLKLLVSGLRIFHSLSRVEGPSHTILNGLTCGSSFVIDS